LVPALVGKTVMRPLYPAAARILDFATDSFRFEAVPQPSEWPRPGDQRKTSQIVTAEIAHFYQFVLCQQCL
jgi:hypothetical protein